MQDRVVSLSPVKYIITSVLLEGPHTSSQALAKACLQCQKLKKHNVHYGLLPPKDIGELQPWHTVHVDLIGPYTVTAKQQ
jgi:hypothetical protein